MDFSLGEDRQMLVDSVGRYLADTFDFSAREKAIASPEGWSRDMWNGVAELGVIGAFFSEDAGGYGGSPFDIGAVFGEVGRAIAVGPFLETLMAGRVLAATDRSEELAGVISGETRITFADTAMMGANGSPVAPMHAASDGDGWKLSGGKGVVGYIAGADLIVVSAQTDKGTSLFLVRGDAAGVSIRDYPLVDGGAAGELTLSDTPAELLGGEGAGQALIDEATAAGLTALSWEAVAIMDVLRTQTLEYLRTRKQFGIPIGKFQALQHRMATVALEIEQARSAAINAAAALDKAPNARDTAASAAKYTIGRVGRLATEEAIQLHGGIAMTWELPLSHYAKRLTMIGHLLGDEDEHLSRYIALRQAA
ncbi:MAG: pimeloyl-CoA dehydrogenase small subunit [Sphingomonas sp.]|nr:pimeloyl-CoA dehydrogenase small subunit [Sphingomonas sp.]